VPGGQTLLLRKVLIPSGDDLTRPHWRRRDLEGVGLLLEGLQGNPGGDDGVPTREEQLHQCPQAERLMEVCD